MTNSPPFTLLGYRQLLEAFKDRQYRSVSLADVDPAARHLILRHDIDLDPDRALLIARVEANLGMSSTYYVLVTTSFYNPVSASSRAVWRQLLLLGHTIGLHLDAAAYPDDPVLLEQGAAHECRILEEAIQAPVTAISFHRPSAALRNRTGNIAGRPHSYQPKFSHDIGYCSDSEGQWRFGSPLVHDAVKLGRALQLLTHPIWWTSETYSGALDRLEEFRRQRSAALRAEMARNLRPFSKEFGPDGRTAPST
jgi:hypothetical protein